MSNKVDMKSPIPPRPRRQSSLAPTATIRLDRVATFVRVVEHGTLTAAAAALGVQTSSVSRDVTILEQDLGVRLLYRTTRRITLTDAGRVYFDRAKAAMRDLEEAGTLLDAMIREPRGVVRVSIRPDLASALIADVVARFVDRYPAITVDLSLDPRPADWERIDVAVRPVRQPDASLIVRKVATIEFGVFASRAYLEKRGVPASLEDLAVHACVQFRVGSAPVAWRFVGPQGRRQISPSGPIVADNLRFVHAALRADAGIGVIPVGMAQEGPDPLVRLLPGYELDGAAVYVMSRARKDLPERVALFRDFVLQELASEKPATRVPAVAAS